MTTNGTTAPPTTKGPSIHGNVTDEAHEAWHYASGAHGVSVSAVLEALGPMLEQLLDDDPGLLQTARRVDAARRGRRILTLQLMLGRLDNVAAKLQYARRQATTDAEAIRWALAELGAPDTPGDTP